MPMAKSLHNSGTESLSLVPWPGELGVQAGPPVQALIHPHVHVPHPSCAASGTEATYSISLWRAEGSQASRSVQAQSWWLMGKAVQSRVMSCRATLAQRERLQQRCLQMVPLSFQKTSGRD